MRKDAGKGIWARVSRLSLSQRIFFIVVALSVISAAAETFFVQRFFHRYVVESSSAKVMAVAQQAAADRDIIAGFGADDPPAAIQPLAERYRLISGTSYVVVFNMDSVRYSHPLTDRLGQRFVGGDELASLEGKTYISQALGTLGLSIRAFVPIRDGGGLQIGAVSVGILLQDLDRETRRIGTILFTAAAFSLVLGLLGAILLSRNIKKTIFGLEPYEIATLLEERNVIISSIKEGIVAIDRDGRIILINENAKRILDIEGPIQGRPVTEVIPNTRLPEVVRGGEPHLDEEQLLNGKVVLVNRIPLVSRSRIIGAVATFRDLSEVRALAEELTEVRGYIDALRAQHHEYLNKLHVISGLLQLGKYDDAVHFIVRTVKVQQRVFDTIRTRIFVPDIAALILAKINEAQEANIDVGLSEKAYLPPLRPESVPFIVTILGNLMQNAIESLRSCSRLEKRVVVDFALSGDELIIGVRDNGDGIPPEIRERVFERGVTSKPLGANMGIGLSLVRMHTTMLGGTIELIEDDGVNAVVRLDRRAVLDGDSR